MRTRLKCALAMLLVAAARLAFAQDIGSKAGVGYSGFSGGSEFDWTRSALSASAFAVVRVHERLELQPELWLRGQSGHSRVSSSELAYTPSYVALPLLARYELSATQATALYLLGGPELAVRARCSLVFSAAAFVSNLGCNDAGRLSLGMDGGAGIELGMKATRIVIEARVSGNLSRNALASDARRVRGNSWSVVVGFVRPLRSVEPSPTPSAPLPRPAPDAPAPPAPAR